LIDTGTERLLVRKQYIGRDEEGRPGNFFTHFLPGLPRSYSARDAIDLWADSSVWITSEQGVSPKEKQLPYLPYSSLCVHQATCEQTFERPAWLDLVGIQTYLPLLIHEYVLYYLHEGKSIQRFYLGSSSSARIASLIWGLAHGLPVGWLRHLTFSTYESDVRP